MSRPHLLHCSDRSAPKHQELPCVIDVQFAMDKEDARQLSPAEQHERRRQVIRASNMRLEGIWGPDQ